MLPRCLTTSGSRQTGAMVPTAYNIWDAMVHVRGPFSMPPPPRTHTQTHTLTMCLQLTQFLGKMADGTVR